MRGRWVWISLVMVGVFLLGGAPALANSADVRIPLRGSAAFPRANGEAKYRDRGGEREFQVEVEDVPRLAGQTLNVFANGVQAGTMRVGPLGNASLNLNTERGQRVPFIRSGSPVRVRTQAGTLVVEGRFP